MERRSVASWNRPGRRISGGLNRLKKTSRISSEPDWQLTAVYDRRTATRSGGFQAAE
jgi:hypothetical protein